MTVKETLIAAKALIDTPDKWTTKGFARDAKGTLLHWGDNWETATCWCSAGAIYAVDTDQVSAVREFARAVLPKVDANWDDELLDKLVGDWNDNHTHEEVMAAFDKAIEAAS